METKHTPGPWFYSISTPAEQNAKWGGNCGATCHIWAKSDKLIFGRDPGKTICYPPHWRNEEENAEQIANIKLIAAAPELLEALKMCIDNMLNGEANTKFRLITCLDAARAAIQKAEG